MKYKVNKRNGRPMSRHERLEKHMRKQREYFQPIYERQNFKKYADLLGIKLLTVNFKSKEWSNNTFSKNITLVNQIITKGVTYDSDMILVRTLDKFYYVHKCRWFIPDGIPYTNSEITEIMKMMYDKATSTEVPKSWLFQPYSEEFSESSRHNTEELRAFINAE